MTSCGDDVQSSSLWFYPTYKNKKERERKKNFFCDLFWFNLFYFIKRVKFTDGSVVDLQSL